MVIFILSLHILSLVLIIYSIRNTHVWHHNAFLGVSSILIPIFSIALGTTVPVRQEPVQLPTIDIIIGESNYVFTVYGDKVSAPEKRQENKQFYKEMSWSFYGIRLYDQVVYK